MCEIPSNATIWEIILQSCLSSGIFFFRQHLLRQVFACWDPHSVSVSRSLGRLPTPASCYCRPWGSVVIAQVIVIRKIWLWPTSVPAILEVNQWMQVPTYHCFSFFLKKKYLYCRSMIKPYLVKITMPKNPFLLSNKKCTRLKIYVFLSWYVLQYG